ncbi:glycosyltransferase [bacterium]|nr:glycosyltransferase [bacterium]
MRVGICLTVKNEEDLILRNIRHHLDTQGVDVIFVFDNNSTDRTPALVQGLKDPRVILAQTPEEWGYRQDLMYTTGVRHLVNKFGCDWAIPTDADEFWVSNRHGTTRAVLEQVPEGIEVTAAHCWHLRETEGDDPGETDFMKRLRYGFLSESRRLIIHKSLVNRIQMLTTGGHELFLHQRYQPLSATLDPDDLVRYHYNYINVERARYRYTTKGEGYLKSLGEKWLQADSNVSRHARRMYLAIREGRFEEEYRTRIAFYGDRLQKAVEKGNLVQLPLPPTPPGDHS